MPLRRVLGHSGTIEGMGRVWTKLRLFASLSIPIKPGFALLLVWFVVSWPKTGNRVNSGLKSRYRPAYCYADLC
jgi:hypothetical protein